MSSGGNTSVRCAGPISGLTKTSTGVRKSVICRGLFKMVLIARSGLAFQAKRIPAAFSTAFDAIATITRPVNTGEMPRDRVAGTSDETNQLETNADARPATASTAIAILSCRCPATRAGTGAVGGTAAGTVAETARPALLGE